MRFIRNRKVLLLRQWDGGRQRLGGDPFGCGRSDLLKVGDARDSYRAALKVADAGHLAPLLAFARS